MKTSAPTHRLPQGAGEALAVGVLGQREQRRVQPGPVAVDDAVDVGDDDVAWRRPR